MSPLRPLSLIAGSLLISACATFPGAEPEKSNRFFAAAPDAPDVWAASGVAGEAPPGNWIALFSDPGLTALVEEALAKNPDLQSQAALVRASEAFVRVASANRKPQIGASVSAGATSTGVRLPTGDERNNADVFGTGLNASWEADFWGRIGKGVREAEANLRASQADLETAELAIAARTAIAWIAYVEAVQQTRVAEETYRTRERVKNLTERRVQQGVSDPLDVRTARSALAGAEASIALRTQLRGEAARRLEVLIGRYPANDMARDARFPRLPALTAEGHPAILLARRPDIAAAEARVEAAGLRAEQARLAMLPSFDLTAGLSTSEPDLSDAFDPALIAARLVASLTAPIYAGGRLDAQRDAAVAQAEAAVANYASAALAAWAEVENAIAADALIEQQVAALARALEEAKFAEELAERQYVSGTVTIFDLINAQTQRLNAESQLVSAEADRAQNRVSYYLALGGAPLATAASEMITTP